MIRVCLVDDQTLVRQGIRSLLALDDGIEVVAEANDGRQAVELVPQVKPDVVLMDMRMPVMSGLEALQALAHLNALPPTIILTTFDDDQLVLAGLKRSEEHTSELQSLMRISYAVFCLKKKTNHRQRHSH